MATPTFQQWQQQNMGPGIRLNDQNDWQYTGPNSNYLVQDGYAYDQSQMPGMDAYNQFLQTLPGFAPPAPGAPNNNLANPAGNIQSFGGSPDIQDSWIPGSVEAQQIYNQGLPALDPNGYLDQAAQNIAGGNPYAQQIGQAPTRNPYGDIKQVGRQAANNPFLEGFQNFQSQANPYADQLFNQSADKIRDRINSQFGAAGQGNSVMNMFEQSDQLGDYGAKFYGGIYDNQQNRLLDAMGRGADVYSTGMDQKLDAFGRASDVRAGNLDRRIDALGIAGDATMKDQMLQSSALPAILGLQQGQPWENLKQYTDIVSQLTGTSPQQPDDPGTSTIDSIIGTLAMAYGLR